MSGLIDSETGFSAAKGFQSQTGLGSTDFTRPTGLGSYLNWDDGQHVVWDNGSHVLWPFVSLACIYVAWDDGQRLIWDNYSMSWLPDSYVTWDDGNRLVWDNGNYNMTWPLIGLSTSYVAWDDGNHLLWDNGTRMPWLTRTEDLS